MDDEELTAVLEDAGLSPYQAEAYVALLQLGTASATDIADKCAVPDPRIYDVLRDLESKGYIETFQQDSLTARANDPKEVLEDLRTRSSRYLAAAESIEDRWNAPEIAEHEVSIVKRFETVRKRALELIEGAESEIQLALSPAQFADFKAALQAAHDRGINVKVCICTADADAVPSESELAGCCIEARYRTLPSPFLVLVDRSWTCFAPHHRSVNEYGVLVHDRTHSYVFHWFFRTCLWEIWDTIHTERTAEPPTTYVDFRQAIRDMEPLLADGATITVTVTGNETESRTPIELTGQITAVDYTGSALGRADPIPLAQLAGSVSATLETPERTYEIGGWGAVIEEIETQRITIEDVRYD